MNFALMISKIETIVSNEFCNELAMRTKFVKRISSRLKGADFFKLLALPNNNLDIENLNNLTLRLRKINPSVDITASALCQRLNKPEAVDFMRHCFNHCLKIFLDQSNNETKKYFQQFNRVFIQDSTCFELNEKLSLFYKGTGGAGSKSAVKFDFIYNCNTEHTEDVAIVPRTVTDHVLADRIINFIKAGDLVLRDLGYFAVPSLEKINELGAFFLSRLRSGLKVYLYNSDVDPIDIINFGDTFKEKIIEFGGFITERKSFVRIVMHRVPQNVFEKRLKKAHRECQRARKPLTQQAIRFLQYTIYVTNIPKELVAADSITTIYGLRWRIELLFKELKTYLKINCFKGENIYRINAFIYARLCMIFIYQHIASWFSYYIREYKKREISFPKFIQYLLIDNLISWAIITDRLKITLRQAMVDSVKKFCKDKRSRKTLLDKLASPDSFQFQGKDNVVLLS